jgi:hypothetical protein
LYDLATHSLRNSVPDVLLPGRSIFQSFRPAGLIEVVPYVKDAECKRRRASPAFGALADAIARTRRMISSFSEAGYLHSSPSPSAITLFLTRVSRILPTACRGMKALSNRPASSIPNGARRHIRERIFQIRQCVRRTVPPGCPCFLYQTRFLCIRAGVSQSHDGSLVQNFDAAKSAGAIPSD